MRVALTGATGFIGGRLSRYLKARGHDVRGIVRSTPTGNGLAARSIATRRADVTDVGSLEDAFRGVDVVMHLAALFNRPQASWDDYRCVNVEGVRNVLEAAQASGVSRVVHCSTVGVATGVGSPPFSEETPYSPPSWDKYETTKCEGEKLALDFHRRTGYPLVVIRPAQVYGPGDTGKAKFYRMVKSGVIINPGDTLKHLIYIDDLCQAFELAAENMEALGEVFIIGGRTPTPLHELIGLVAQQLGVARPSIVLPATPVTWLCTSTELVCNLAQVKPVLFRRSMDFFTRSVQFDVSKARHVLRFEDRIDVPDGIAETARWYAQKGLI
jgi:nucleoside-diphosphate-sugar epimerase